MGDDGEAGKRSGDGDGKSTCSGDEVALFFAVFSSGEIQDSNAACSSAGISGNLGDGGV